MRIKLRSNLTRKEDYEAALAIVQTKVLAKHSVVNQQFKKWEQNFFLEHECFEPSPEDIRNDRQGHDFYKTSFYSIGTQQYTCNFKINVTLCHMGKIVLLM